MDSPSHIHSILQQLLCSHETSLHLILAITNELSSFNQELSFCNYTLTPTLPWTSYNTCHHHHSQTTTSPWTSSTSFHLQPVLNNTLALSSSTHTTASPTLPLNLHNPSHIHPLPRRSDTFFNHPSSSYISPTLQGHNVESETQRETSHTNPTPDCKIITTSIPKKVFDVTPTFSSSALKEREETHPLGFDGNICFSSIDSNYQVTEEELMLLSEAFQDSSSYDTVLPSEIGAISLSSLSSPPPKPVKSPDRDLYTSPNITHISLLTPPPPLLRPRPVSSPKPPDPYVQRLLMEFQPTPLRLSPLKPPDRNFNTTVEVQTSSNLTPTLPPPKPPDGVSVLTPTPPY